jgi:hypothetical protein
MDGLAGLRDVERAHVAADLILVEVIERLTQGHSNPAVSKAAADLVRSYNRVPKEYA